MDSNSLTIAEIAKRAGVGTATVDRVLHKRLGVNAETTKRVLQVMAEVSVGKRVRGRPYQRDALRLAYVLPDGAAPLFSQIERQIALSAGELRHQHITALVYRFSFEYASQYAADLAQLLDCDGVALLALDMPVVKRAIGDLVRAGVHVVTLFSDVAGSARQLFVGADNRAAGRTAGLLLGNMATAAAQDRVMLLAQATRLSSEIERRIGFAQVLEERFPHLQLLRITDLPLNEDALRHAMLGHLQAAQQEKRLAGLYLAGAGVEGVVGALAQLNLTGALAVVAHDLNDIHARLLSRGALSYLLNHDVHYCVVTAAHALRKLAEGARGALHVAQPRIEILTSENLH